MAQRTFCDGCGTEAPHLLKRKGEDGVERCPPVGEPGDGMRRQLELRFGNNSVTMDLCVACHKRAKSFLLEAFPEMARQRENWWGAMGVDEHEREREHKNAP